jgi:oligo-alginate lyase
MRATLWSPPYSELHRFLAPGTADDPTRLMSGLMLRSKGYAATFIAAYRSGHKPVRLDLSACKMSGPYITGGALAVHTDTGVWSCVLDAERGLLADRK